MTGSRAIVSSIESEYRRYKALGDSAMAQLPDAELGTAGPGGGSSVAIIVWHVAGNFASRFTDFLTSDGEKAWRDRDGEFEPRTRARAELEAHWERGWETLFLALSQLEDSHLQHTVRIRGTELSVGEALHRSLAHATYHIGQLVYVAKAIMGSKWKHLSIPPGGSADYNRNPTLERPENHAARLKPPRGATEE